MAKFIKVPPLDIGNKGEWILKDDLIYHSDLLDYQIIVPEGFVSDLASIPPIFTPIFRKNGNHRKASLVHDFLVGQEGFPRKTADRIFLEAMKISQVSKWKRYLMYVAVRIGALRKKK